MNKTRLDSYYQDCGDTCTDPPYAGSCAVCRSDAQSRIPHSK